MHGTGVCVPVYHSAQGCAKTLSIPLFLPSTHSVRHLPRYPMSSVSNTAFTSSNFQTIFNVALTKYTKQTGKDLRDHPLAHRINSCQSPDSVLDIFQEQSRAFDEFKNGDTKLFKWLRPVVDVLHALSTNPILSDGGCLVSPPTFLVIQFMCLNTLSPQVFPPAKAVFSGIGILLSVRISRIISAPFIVTFTFRRPNL